MVKNMMDADGRKTPFVDNMPGKRWFRSYLVRNPRLVVYFEHKRKAKKVIRSETLEKWFSMFKAHLQERNCFSILEFPDRMWHLEELSFGLGKDGHRVQGFRIKSSFTGGRTTDPLKAQITTLLGVSASGIYSPPMFCYPGKDLPEGLSQPSDGSECFMESGQRGRIDGEVFLDWLKEHFHPFLVKRGVHFPVLVLVDGSSTYMQGATVRLEQFCDEKGIILFRRPTESSQLVNPMGLGVRSLLKDAYLQEVKSWRREHPCQFVSSSSFHDVFLDALAAIAKKPELAQLGFWCAGLFPFDGRYNKDKDKHPSIHEAQTNASEVVVPTSSNGTSVLASVPSEGGFLETVEVSIADQEILELISASDTCEVFVKRPSTSQDVAAEGSQSSTTQTATSVGRPERSARRSWNGQRWTAPTSSPTVKSTSTAAKRKSGEKSSIRSHTVQNTPRTKSRKPNDVSTERPGNELQQKRWTVRDAKSTLREAKRVAHEAITEVKELKKEIKVAVVVERDARKDVREAQKALKAAEHDLRQYRLNEISGQENPSGAWMEVDVDENTCPGCGGNYVDRDLSDKWVSCCNCPRRYHVMCTDLFCVPEEKIPHVQYRCPFCVYM